MRKPLDDAALDRAADLVIRERAAPAASVAVAVRRGGEFRVGSGSAGAARMLGSAPLFDLASLTKPFVAVAAARLVRGRALDFEMPLGGLLPELGGTPSASVAFALLLAHRAGLEAHRALFEPLLAGRPFERRAALLEAASARRESCTGDVPGEGFAPVYSDLGYALAGAALERISGLPLDELVEREVCAPFGIAARSARLWLAALPDFSSRVAPTETMSFRGGEIRAATHDENAWAFAGHGLAGQAGLFGTAEAVARFGAIVLDAAAGRLPSFLMPDELFPLIRTRPGGSLRAGFDGKSGPSSAAGSRANPDTYGHLGFTGTSLWCDPAAERVTVLLSNRVCPTRENLSIRAVRPRVHDALYDWEPARDASGVSR